MRGLADRVGKFVSVDVVRRALVGMTLVVIAIASLSIIALVSLIDDTPHWWRDVAPQDPITVDLAERVERGLLNTFHKRRVIGDPWTIKIEAVEANAWLNAKLPKWMANKEMPWPDELREVQAEFAQGSFSLGFRIVAEGTDQIVAATVTPMLGGDGSLWLPISAASAGRLDLPRRWTIPKLRDWLPEDMQESETANHVLSALEGAAPLAPDAVIRLEDGRQVRILGMRAEDGEFLLTCVTERRTEVRQASSDES